MRAARGMAIVAAFACFACKSEAPAPSRDDCRDASAAAASANVAGLVDPALVAFLSKARAVHLQADLAEGSGDAGEAIRLLEGLVRAPTLGGERPSPEVREVLADTSARLAELEAAGGDLEAARQSVRRGMTLATERTHYRGRLFEVLGAIERRDHDERRARGDEAGARAAKERSVAALREAVATQEEVIQRALEGGRSP
ncbi:MAG: hypothetical protein FJ096_21400 [Deltaproteobacteria bacterium]|nr:hypothetical protein [Deltaproteobacteria bacterium]